ncbi:triacylglycerol lipase [Oxynema sp. CENA135]|uniref:esterase/lipase family protein n=1 Tax=Oxynema sp. CENA135 TaxID=984206 RepID=UPI00190DE246|nr:triacylglycerol lipase [Oxynema sp. CENA135]MBK4731061.1 triacylglycerol lipase [Oxynema sp. CENA135]
MQNSIRKNPVLLVHGIWDKGTIFKPMSAYLRQYGWEVHTVDLEPNDSSVGLDQLAQQVRDYADCHLSDDRPFDLLGFSMGGLVSRYYLQRLGGVDRVDRFITISSPHNGTWTGYALALEGSIQMRPNSPFLQDLNRDAIETLSRVNFTSIWTPFDLMILPANSSQLPVGDEVKISVGLHRWMVSDRRCLDTIARTLSQPCPKAAKLATIAR